MRKTLLSYICCPACRSNLEYIAEKSSRVGSSSHEQEIIQGMLVCSKCKHWFPIRNYIPELLPDHLRDWENDSNFLNELDLNVDLKLLDKLIKKTKSVQKKVIRIKDTGVNYKKSEISITDKVTHPDFFGPGYISPFNPGNTEFTMQLIRRFGNTIPALKLKQNDIVLDIGAGYAWTTEWLLKMGTEPIGVDICRTYLDIGIKRMGTRLPHLIVADVENLPIKNNRVNAILCYDAFHHIPNRKTAMQHFYRILLAGGNIVLAEPGPEHEEAPISQEVMEKYGILEKGMSLTDIKDYCAKLKDLSFQQQYVISINQDEQDLTLSPDIIRSHYYMDTQLYIINKHKS